MHRKGRTKRDNSTPLSFTWWSGLAVCPEYLLLSRRLLWPRGYLRWSLILLFMVVKAGLIVAIFMHMAWERLALMYAILVPPARCCCLWRSWRSNRITRTSRGSHFRNGER